MVRETAKRRRWGKILLIWLVTVVAIAGIVGGTFALNQYEDRRRAMYHDVLLMADLQWTLLNEGQEGVAMVIDRDTGPVVVGDTTFQALPGITIQVVPAGEVETGDDGVCVKGYNEHDDQTDWVCVDGTDEPPEMGSLAEQEF
ncbi:hypothetical protein [Nocardioides stalactiti]|uniref:hypothetical protein n=1 Tax=Nocardioides stalactiti TaxID=2755356 RepID=UPI0016031150|nr:hypothetical protein [Nocardioides stalactiti]